jgi:tRNA dimethylallyltransferase
MSSKKPLAVIVGPTASGKTAIAVEIAKRLGGEVISADSVAIYTGLDIGSAKPTVAERQGIPHHMIDCADPAKSFTVSDYQREARNAIESVHSRGRLPILAGGTGLYVNAVISDLDFTEAGRDEAFRLAWMEKEQQCPGTAYAELERVDPKRAAELHKNDFKRILRALEVFHLTGRPMSDQNGAFQKNESPYQLAIAGLTMPREMLYARIEQRVDRMLSDGLVNEVQGLLNAGLDPRAPSMQGLGYKEIIDYLTGKQTLAQAVYLIKQNTRRFAKRQLTWFKRDERTVWFDVSKCEKAELANRIEDYFRNALQ